MRSNRADPLTISVFLPPPHLSPFQRRHEEEEEEEDDDSGPSPTAPGSPESGVYSRPDTEPGLETPGGGGGLRSLEAVTMTSATGPNNNNDGERSPSSSSSSSARLRGQATFLGWRTPWLDRFMTPRWLLACLCLAGIVQVREGGSVEGAVQYIHTNLTNIGATMLQ